MISKVTDNELWDAVVSDNSRAFVVLYNRYWKKLYKTANYYLKDETAAEEITHDVFVALWTRRKYLKIQNFQNYIHVTARYHVFKHLKAAKVNCIEYIDQFTLTDDVVVYNTADSKLEYEGFESELAQILRKLPRRCQEIFWLSRVENLSNDEIADKLHISKRTVENQITLALRFLRMSYPQLSLVSMMILIALSVISIFR
ncbi:MAG: polymerase sigma-70 factor [Mucilaginibacter sp.]|nr:polymerase sigma-70 factor [Mucilaginibacter sp.]